MRKFTAVAATLMLAVGVAACGGDDDDATGDDAPAATADAAENDGDDNGGGGGDQQEAAAEKFIEQAEAAGIETDEDCVREKADRLSDADAKTIVDAGDDGTFELSPEGEALTLELASCVSTEDLMDEVLSSLPEGVDEDCVRDALEGVDLAAMAEGQTPPEFVTAMTECVTGG